MRSSKQTKTELLLFIGVTTLVYLASFDAKQPSDNQKRKKR